MFSNKNQIMVRMGSRKIVLEFAASEKEIKAIVVVELALQRCKMDKKLAGTYDLYESRCGVESLLTNSITNTTGNQSEFIIRKRVLNENRLNGDMLKKCYKKLKQSQQQEEQVKQNYVDLIVQNEIEIRRQQEQLEQDNFVNPQAKMCHFHHEQLVNTLANNKLVDNINFLQFLYYKLKKQNAVNTGELQSNSDYARLIDCNSGDEDSLSFDSRRSSSSIGTLESLV